MKTQKPAAITLKKMPQPGDIAPQAFAILGVLKAKGGELTVDALKKAMEGKIASKQSMAALWVHYHKILSKKGFIRMKGAAR